MIKIFKEKEAIEDFFKREIEKNDVSDIVSDIIYDVRKNKDEALFKYCKKFDKADLKELKVTEEEIEEAISLVEPRFLEILQKAEKNIKEFHEKQVKEGFKIEKEDGIIIGQKITPIKSVGLYVPGGTAAYPSTVLMDSIPAKIAGCEEIVMVSPPNSEGKINPVILAAAKIAGVTKIYKIGGAQAIAALAYGTESVPKVDKIVGPGNAFVAEAKKQVFGVVDIDMIAGPSEILIIADKKSNPSHIAADLLSQAEHDRKAAAVLVTDSEQIANKTAQELEKQIPKLNRSEIARESIDNCSAIIVAKELKEVIEVSNEIAPEHLELMVDNPFDYLDSIKNAGSIFLGRYCPEALGDYYAGPNHTLPTMGTAKFSSALSVDDFVKKSQYTYYTKEALYKAAKDVAYFAQKEGLDAHAKSVTVRIEEEWWVVF